MLVCTASVVIGLLSCSVMVKCVVVKLLRASLIWANDHEACHGQTVMDTSFLSGLMITKRVMVKLLWTPTCLLCRLMTPSEACHCQTVMDTYLLVMWTNDT